MRTHVVEIGPNAVRRLCCGAGSVTDPDMERTAFDSVDDAVALVDSRPVTVESVWRRVLKSVSCAGTESVVVIYPSWWSPSRVAVATAAAPVLGSDVVLKPRSWLLGHASRDSAVLVEITDGFVVVTGDEVVAETRRREQRGVVDAVVRRVSATAGPVVIDAPPTVQGAGDLSAMIAKRLRDSGATTVIQVDDIALRKLAGSLVPDDTTPRVGRPLWRLAVVPIGAVVVGVGALLCHPRPPMRVAISATDLVEGHVAVEVPVDWPVQRVVAGPGSARLQISSPSDPEVALLVTQSRVALDSLEATAEFLRDAIDAAPAGVFVDFNAAGRSAGRPVVTYREIRTSHEVRWTVWVDHAVRISIGCQSRHGREETVRPECERAIRSARTLM